MQPQTNKYKFIKIFSITFLILVFFLLQYFHFIPFLDFGISRKLNYEMRDLKISLNVPISFRPVYEFDFSNHKSVSFDPYGFGPKFDCYWDIPEVVDITVYHPDTIAAPEILRQYSANGLPEYRKIGNYDYYVFDNYYREKFKDYTKAYIHIHKQFILIVEYNRDSCDSNTRNYDRHFEKIISTIKVTPKPDMNSQVKFPQILNSAESKPEGLVKFPTLNDFRNSVENTTEVRPGVFLIGNKDPSYVDNNYYLSHAPNWNFKLPQKRLPDVNTSSINEYVEALYKPAMKFKFKLKALPGYNPNASIVVESPTNKVLKIKLSDIASDYKEFEITVRNISTIIETNIRFYIYENEKDGSSQAELVPISITGDGGDTVLTDLTQTYKAAYIKYIEGDKITLDFFYYLTGPAAVSAATADGKCTEDSCLPNGDIYFKNTEIKSETFTLSPDATIISTYAFEKSPTGEANITLAELKKDYVDAGVDVGNEIKFNDKNEVVYIKQIFRP